MLCDSQYAQRALRVGLLCKPKSSIVLYRKCLTHEKIKTCIDDKHTLKYRHCMSFLKSMCGPINVFMANSMDISVAYNISNTFFHNLKAYKRTHMHTHFYTFTIRYRVMELESPYVSVEICVCQFAFRSHKHQFGLVCCCFADWFVSHRVVFALVWFKFELYNSVMGFFCTLPVVWFHVKRIV